MNKKIFALLLCVTLLCMLAVPAAAANAPVITLQPQSYHYPEYSVAVYTVEATGEYLSATWYLKYEGKTYNLSKNSGENCGNCFGQCCVVGTGKNRPFGQGCPHD